MKTFILNMPRELIAGKLTTGPGKFCAIGILLHEVLGVAIQRDEHMSWGFPAGQLRSPSLEQTLSLPTNWWAATVHQNNGLTNPTSRVTNLKRRLRALESYGYVEFLFLNEGEAKKEELAEVAYS